MSKAVLISIRPEWCEKIGSGEKTIEVRKTRPKIETPFKCYIYCTKPAFPHEDYLVFDAGTNKVKAFYGGGKVIGEFVCDATFPMSFYASDASFFDDVPPFAVPGTCLTDKEIAEYLGNGKTGYGWNISDLVIYDEPMELSEFMKSCPYNHNCAACKWYWPGIQDYDRCEPPCCGYWESNESLIERPPQSWCYVEGEGE